ncbi:MAG TPA: DMT family transporter [Kineosporiaceae bacterium]|nr:DMT family transporter [Kineosporiaceae bacterium]
MTRRAAFLFIALGVAWGIPYFLIKIAVGELPPSTLVLARTALAALILLPIALARSDVATVARHWRPVLAYTVVEIVLPWIFLSRAEQHLPSSTTGLLITAVPIVGVLVAKAGGRAEPLGGRGWLGLALATAGVAALVGLDLGGSDLPAVAQMGVVVIGYAVGPAILARWLSDVSGLGVMAVSLTAAALIYVPVVLIGPGLPARLPSGGVIASVIVLAVVCTAVAFLLLFALVAELGPVRSTAIVYLNPVVAIAAGAVFLHEKVTIWTLIGFALALTGSVLITRRTPARTASPVPHPEVTRTQMVGTS